MFFCDTPHETVKNIKPAVAEKGGNSNHRQISTVSTVAFIGLEKGNPANNLEYSSVTIKIKPAIFYC